MVSTWRRASGPPRRVSLRYTTMSPSYCIEFDPRFRNHIGCSVRTSSYALSVRAAWISGSVIRLRSGRALGLSLVAFGGEHPSTSARARANRPIRGIDGLLVAIVGSGRPALRGRAFVTDSVRSVPPSVKSRWQEKRKDEARPGRNSHPADETRLAAGDALGTPRASFFRCRRPSRCRGTPAARG